MPPTEKFGLRLPVLDRRPLCAGLSPIFDDLIPGEDLDAREERFVIARAVCSLCPAARSCAEQIDTRDRGVWAGRVLVDRRGHQKHDTTRGTST